MEKNGADGNACGGFAGERLELGEVFPENHSDSRPRPDHRTDARDKTDRDEARDDFAASGTKESFGRSTTDIQLSTQGFGGEDGEERRVEDEVKESDRESSDEEGGGDGALGGADFADDISGCVPARISKKGKP